MYQSKQIAIRKFQNGAWWLTDADGEEFNVSSINNHCKRKLQAIHEEHNGQAYMTLEKITEYHSDEYRCKISSVADQDWRDDDVYCLVTNETGNLNPNAERDIAAATARLKSMGIL